VTYAKPAIPVNSAILFKTVHLAMSVTPARYNIPVHPVILVRIATLARPVTLVNFAGDHDS
jgi:hypothetical protein